METEPLVLVCDDNDDDRRIFSTVLELNGCQVVEATDGLEAVRIARKLTPAAIVMDVRMLGLDGLSAAEILRAIPETSAIPILCVSGFGINPVAAADAGCDRILQKPVEPSLVAATVLNLIEAKHTHHGRTPETGASP
jgi:two-component system, OmpR family, alkaline phosphatase synthesis response regulator PhoP